MPKPSKDGYPTIAWNADGKRLIHKLFNVLEENNTIRRGIWPRRGEATSGSTKTVHRKNIAKKLLRAEPKFKNLLENPKALTHYGIAVKNQLARLEDGWKKAKQSLGITGAGLVNEDDIWEGSNKLRNKWKEVKKIYPWFFKIRV